MQQYFISGAEKFNYQNGAYENRCVVQVQYRTPKGKVNTISIRDVPGLQAEFRKYASHNNKYGMILKPYEFVPYNNDIFSVTQFAVLTDDGRMLLGSDTLQHWDIQFFVTKDFALQAGWIKSNQLTNEPNDTDLPPEPVPPKKVSKPASEEMTSEEMVTRFREIFAIAESERTEEEKVELSRLAPIVNEYLKRKIMGQIGITLNTQNTPNTPKSKNYTEELFQLCLLFDKKKIDWETFKKRAHSLGSEIGKKDRLIEVAEAVAEKCRVNKLSVTLRHIEYGFDGIDGFMS